MRKKKMNLATQYIVIVCALLLAANVILGAVLMSLSGTGLRSMVERHMLSVADTTAAVLDGDVLRDLTYEDFKTRSDAFMSIYNDLENVVNAQEDSDIKYVYTVKKDGSRFVFTVDPDPVSPGEFGEEVVATPSQQVAWEGRCCVDKQAYEDEWGKFYTAWSPVRDSDGRVVGLVAVDFVADWYDQQIRLHTVSVVICGALSLAVGAAMMVLMTGQLRRRISNLNGEILILSRDVEQLSDEIRVRPGEETPAYVPPDGAVDSIGELSVQLKDMQKKLRNYMAYAREQAYTDSMTGVGNKTAYLEYVKELNRQIDEGTADFAIAVFDINGLKKTNDNFGHECGDRLIVDSAKAICRVFDGEQVFRIGGDEFIAVLGPTTGEELEEKFGKLGEVVANFNQTEKQYSMTLSFSWGGTVYVPGQDADYKEVFRRADEAMYRNKGEYYRQFGDRRRRRDDDRNNG